MHVPPHRVLPSGQPVGGEGIRRRGGAAEAGRLFNAWLLCGELNQLMNTPTDVRKSQCDAHGSISLLPAHLKYKTDACPSERMGNHTSPLTAIPAVGQADQVALTLLAQFCVGCAALDQWGSHMAQQQRLCAAVDRSGAGPSQPTALHCTHSGAPPDRNRSATCAPPGSHLGFGVDARSAAQLARLVVGRAALIIADASLAAHFARRVVGLAAAVDAGIGSALSLALRATCKRGGRQ